MHVRKHNLIEKDSDCCYIYLQWNDIVQPCVGIPKQEKTVKSLQLTFSAITLSPVCLFPSYIWMKMMDFNFNIFFFKYLYTRKNVLVHDAIIC